MPTSRNARAVGFVLAAILLTPTAAARAQTPTIVITDLGTLGGSQSEARAVDASGRVVGSSWTVGDAAQHAFLWTSASGMFDLGTLGGTSSVATAIAGGTVVGTSSTTGDIAQHAFIWTAATGMRDLGTLGGASSAATAVNASGTVVGVSAIAGEAKHAFAWTSDGGMLDLGTLGGTYSAAAAVNAAGTVAGASTIASDLGPRAFIWTPASGMVEIGTLGGSSSTAAAVNASGVVVGTSTIAGDVALHGFVWTAGNIVDLGTLGGTSSAATSVNQDGAVAGVSASAGDDHQHAFIWTAAAGMLDLETLGGPQSTATGMNDVGQVVGYSDLPTDSRSPMHHAVLWQVGPKTTTLMVTAAPGVFGGTTSMRATLSSASGPTSGASVIFFVKGIRVGAATTDGNGVATLVDVPLTGLTAGAHPGGVGALFAGTLSELTSNATADLVISKAVPVVTWSNPQPIVSGTPLSAMQLNATASVPGAFAYSPQSGTVLNAGPAQPLSVTFTPADAVNLTTATAGVVLSVTPATPTLTLEGIVDTAGSGERVVEATGSDTLVSWPAPAARDATSRSLPVACLPRSGSLFSLGSTTVACSAADSAGNAVTATFVLTVRDTTPPALVVPDHVTATATNPAGGTVTYLALATDLVNRVVPTACVPASGTSFPYGLTNVSCTATDTAGNSTTKSFNVTVDTKPPTLSLPSATSVEATGAAGAAVNFAASAVDAGDQALAVRCAPASGTLFAIATTTVTCSAVDLRGNAVRGSFKVTVRDTTPPTINGLNGDLAVEATGPDGAQVRWTAPVGTDTVSGRLPVSCAPASGGTFPLGQTTVTCSSTDAAGNLARTTFSVRVLDTTPPKLFGIPLDLTLESIGPSGTAASWTMPTAVDTVDGSVAVVCSPASGSAFMPGTSSVTCSSTDAHDNRASVAFHVTVQDPTPPVISPTVTGPLGTNGWYVGDVKVTWIVTDLESSISATIGCDPVAATADTASATFTCQATSAGGTASKTVAIKIDRSPPSASALRSPAANSNGWNNSPVTVWFECADGLSGLAAGNPAPNVVSTEAAGQSVASTCADLAGNSASLTVTGINIDLTAPSIAVPDNLIVQQNGPAGAVVVYSAPAIDTASGVASSTCLPASGDIFPIGLTTVTCTASDLAGNTTSATFTIDVTPIAITSDGRSRKRRRSRGGRTE